MALDVAFGGFFQRIFMPLTNFHNCCIMEPNKEIESDCNSNHVSHENGWLTFISKFCVKQSNFQGEPFINIHSFNI